MHLRRVYLAATLVVVLRASDGAVAASARSVEEEIAAALTQATQLGDVGGALALVRRLAPPDAIVCTDDAEPHSRGSFLDRAISYDSAAVWSADDAAASRPAPDGARAASDAKEEGDNGALGTAAQQQAAARCGALLCVLVADAPGGLRALRWAAEQRNRSFSSASNGGDTGGDGGGTGARGGCPPLHRPFFSAAVRGRVVCVCVGVLMC